MIQTKNRPSAIAFAIAKTMLLLAMLLILPGLVAAQDKNKNYLLALDKAKAGNYAESLKDVDKALKKEPRNTEYLMLKAQVLHKLKRHQESYDYYSAIIALDPSLGRAYERRAHLLETLMEFEAAIADYTEAIARATDDTLKHTFYTNRSAAYMASRNFDAAYADLMRAYAFDSTNLGVLTNLGAVCDEVGRGHETLKYLFKAIEEDPRFVGAYANIGYKYQNMGDHKKAIEYYNKVLELEPNEALGYSNRSFSRLKLGDVKGAEKDIERALKLYPTNSYAYKIRALVFIEQGRLNEACRDLETALTYGYRTMYGDEVTQLARQYCGN